MPTEPSGRIVAEGSVIESDTGIPMQIFLSYDRSDEEFAMALSEQLEKHGLTVWRGAAEVLPGENLWERIGAALKASKAMIVLLSPDSVRSETQRREIEYVLGDPKFQGRVFPVQIRPTQNIPWILRKFNLLDAKLGAAKVGATIAEAAKLAPSLK
jgi:hypothetical protein